MTTVALLGTLDTKGDEYEFLRARLVDHGCDVLLIDTGVLGEPTTVPDITRDSVAHAAGSTVDQLVDMRDRASAMASMGAGASAMVARLHSEGRLDAVLALGGSGGTHLACTAMRGLPLGVGKVMVSTMASGMTREYVGTSDITMMHAVTDISGVNSLSAPILANAAAAAAGMANAAAPPNSTDRPVVAVSMVGLTTPGIDVLRQRLDALGYEVVVFHATGVGGRTLESLVRQGRVAAVADATPTELVDEEFGGICAAGPDRMSAAGERGLAQVVSLGALDMINFGPPATVPDRFVGRITHVHNAQITLVRTNVQECATLGEMIAGKLNAARGPVSVFLPERGFSAISTAGEPFHDPHADQAVIEALCGSVEPHITVHRVDADANDPELAVAMADELDTLRRTLLPESKGPA